MRLFVVSSLTQMPSCTPRGWAAWYVFAGLVQLGSACSCDLQRLDPWPWAATLLSVRWHPEFGFSFGEPEECDQAKEPVARRLESKGLIRIERRCRGLHDRGADRRLPRPAPGVVGPLDRAAFPRLEDGRSRPVTRPLGHNQLLTLLHMASPAMILLTPDQIAWSLHRRGLLQRHPAGAGALHISPAGMRCLADAYEAGQLDRFMPVAPKGTG